MKRITYPLTTILLCACTAAPESGGAITPPTASDQAAGAAAPPPPPPPPPDPASKIRDYVLDPPYDRASYPKLAKKLGPAFNRIDSVRAAAALHAARSSRCDAVELSEVSEPRSTPENITMFVDCTNRERFYVSEADLASGAGAIAQSDKTVSRSSAIQACADAARAETLFPSLADVHVWTGASFSTFKTTGAARVLLNFDATNALGIELPYQAECLFQAGGAAGEITIRPR